MLHHSLTTYSQTLQRLDQFVLAQPQRVLYLTITELARESGTSEASVTRLGCVPKVVEKRSPHFIEPYPSKNTAFIHFKTT